LRKLSIEFKVASEKVSLKNIR